MSPGITVRIIKTFVFSNDGMYHLSIAQDKIYFIANLPEGGSTGDHIPAINNAESIPVIRLATLNTQLILSCSMISNHIPSNVRVNISQSFRQCDGPSRTVRVLVF